MKWFKERSLRGKILLTVASASLICAVISITGFLYFNHQAVVHGIENKERTILVQLEAARDFVALQGGLDATIARIKAKHTSAQTLSKEEKEEVFNQVPIVSALKIGFQNQEKDHYKFRVFSDQPRRKENLATSAELEIFKRFTADEGLKEIVANDGEVITTYRPVRLSKSQGCLNCHGHPNTSPWGDGKDILGFEMEDFKDGQMHGVFAVSESIDEVVAAANEGHILSPETALVGAIIIGSLMALLLAAWMARGPIDELNRVVSSLADSRTQIADASQQSAASATQLSEASTQQAASLQETMASVEEISAMVAQNADSATKVKSAVDDNQRASEEGNRSVAEMQKAIEEIRETNEQALGQMEASNKEFGEIVKVISEIGEKTKVINDIVFQTKLLSFNASVEAARAGEHGKGFAVVAEEVGNLAQMSGNAAKEIGEMLSVSIKKVNDIVEQTTRRVEHLVEAGKDKITMGQATAGRCREALDKIDSNARSVAAMITEITHASKEQAQGVQEINKAISQLDQVTQQNAAVAQESSSQAEQLNSEAVALSEAVSALVVSVRGRIDDEPAEPGSGASRRQSSHVSNVTKLTLKPSRSSKVRPVAKKVSGSDVPAGDHPEFEEF